LFANNMIVSVTMCI